MADKVYLVYLNIYDSDENLKIQKIVGVFDSSKSACNYIREQFSADIEDLKEFYDNSPIYQRMFETFDDYWNKGTFSVRNYGPNSMPTDRTLRRKYGYIFKTTLGTVHSYKIQEREVEHYD